MKINDNFLLVLYLSLLIIRQYGKFIYWNFVRYINQISHYVTVCKKVNSHCHEIRNILNATLRQPSLLRSWCFLISDFLRFDYFCIIFGDKNLWAIKVSGDNQFHRFSSFCFWLLIICWRIHYCLERLTCVLRRS